MNEPDWAKHFPWAVIEVAAQSHSLEPEFVAAVIATESMGNTHAIRYEPSFEWTENIDLYAKEIGCTWLTMQYMQKTSWGLMQVMGAVAYEHGLLLMPNPHHRWPTALLIPRIGAQFGCLHLKKKFDLYGPRPDAVYAAYNAGSARTDMSGRFTNQVNVDRFLEYYAQLRD